ncbi:MAG: hypothetical protein Q7T54_01010 [Candidatus Levybacteria bacterium]|nr:hypothetical protein [Candidatus Levybacteria bacterium]
MWDSEEEKITTKSLRRRHLRVKKLAIKHLFKFKLSYFKKFSPRKIKFTKKKVSIAFFALVIISFSSAFLINKILNPHYFKGAITLDKTTYTVEDDIKVNLQNINSDTDKVIIRLENDKGQEIQTENVKQLGSDKSLALSIVPVKHLKPGRYKIRASDFYGNSIVQDFTWGVLAINTNKSVYSPNDKANFAMAVLDAEGKMVCDAKVTLTVTLPQSGKKEVLSTDNGKLKTTPQCDSYGFSLMPDFVSELQLSELGQYKMHLASVTKTGNFEIDDSFNVQENIPFDVERITATRIYPYFAYPVTLKIRANQDFDGKIVELVPEEFGVSYDTKKNVPKLESKKGRKILTWKVKIKKGEEIDLTYKYKSPLASPDFYLLGKASLIEDNTTVFEETRKWQIAIDVIGGPTEVTPNADNGAQAWTCTAGTDGNCGTGHYTVVDDGSASPSTSGYVSVAGGAGGDGEIDVWDTTTFTPSDVLVAVTSVTVYIYDQSATTPAGGGTTDSISLSIYMGGAYQTNQDVTPAILSWGWQSATFTGTWTQNDIDNMRIRVIRNKLGSGNPSAQSDNLQIAAAYATVTYNYSPMPPKITQEGYTFENDDEDQATTDANDSNTVQAGTTFTSGKTLTSVKKGERMTLRMHVKNTASASGTQKFGLFYDRNDGIFSKVSATATVSATAGNCTDTNWDCMTIEDNGSILGAYSSVAVSPQGVPWISYYDQSAQSLKVAQYVGGGGMGCASNSAWNCSTIEDTASNVGLFTVLAFDSGGNAWIGYHDFSAGSLKVAQFVGTGGTGCTTSTAWTCTVVEDVADTVGYTMGIAIDGDGNPWISYKDQSIHTLKVAQYVGSGGTGCTSAAWTCTTIDDPANNVGNYTSITFDNTGTAWISYTDISAFALKVAKYVGTGGSGCTSSAWTCTTVDDHATDDLGSFTSIAADPSGTVWVSYYDGTALSLKVAKYVGSGGNCDTAPQTGSDAWDCTVVDNTTNDVGYYSSIAFSPSGSAFVAYKDNTAPTRVKLAQFVSSSGSGCTSSAWTCTALDDPTNSVGENISIAFDGHGAGWVSYQDTSASALRVANIKRGGEIAISPSLSGATGDSLSASHADMTSATDSTSQGDADCLSATTWNNGKLFEAEEGSLTIPDGSQESQCTEIAYVIDTSQAVAGTTYRFIISTDDGFNQDKGKWRGPIAVSTNGYPTLTIESDSTTPFNRYSKDNIADFSDCTSTSWGCLDFMDDGASVTGEYSSIAIDGSGKAWIGYFANGTGQLRVAKYVGSGGTGCTLSTVWTCTTVDDPASNSVGSHVSIAIDKSGNPWIAYSDSSAAGLKVAQYVGSGGSGCGSGSAEWTCITVDDHATDNIGQYTSLAFDSSGNPWISYFNNTTFAVVVANYVGSGGNCDSYLSHTGSDAWNCTVVDDHASDSLGAYTSIAVDSDGKPWISYKDNTAFSLKVANYVGSGGNCDTAPENGSDAWNCTTVQDNADNYGNYTSIAFDQSGTSWVAVYDSSVHYVGIAKLHVPAVKPVSSNQYNFSGRNAKGGTARYMLSSGKAPATESGSCSGIADNEGYCALSADDSDFDSITALPTERPLAVFAIRGSSNATAPTGTWIGRTNLAPNTGSTAGDIKMEVYRFGSTNAWEALASDTTSSNCSTADCTVSATAAGTASEYFEADGSNYWTYLRVYQIGDGSTTVTLKSDYISAEAPTPPTVTTDAATSVTASSATLNSTVNPNGLSTDVFYKYDTADVACASLSSTTSTSNIGSGSTNVSPNSVPISGLSSSMTYYFCAGATNADGTTYGSKLNFTTSASGSVDKVIRGGIQIRGGVSF